MKNGKTVEENLVSLISKIGEKITLGRAKTLENKMEKILHINIQLLKIMFQN